MKRILSLCLCLLMVLSLFAGCGEDKPETTQPTEHKHTYSKTWSSDETGHWYAADCGHDVKVNQGEHIDSDNDGTCDICAWADNSCQHTFDEEKWLSDETNHWHGATCQHYGAVKDQAAHVDENNDGACDVCGYTGDHTHSFAAEWSSDATSHWYASTCGHDIKANQEAHSDVNKDGLCDVCGWFDETHQHTFGDSWETDVVYHWHGATCAHTGAFADRAEHADADGDKLCDTCAFEMCDHEDYDQDGQCDLCGWADPKHSHEFGELTYDKTHHWNVATCHPGASSEKQEHVDANRDGVCDVCTFQICGHSFAAEWTSDETHHWHAILCTCNIPRKDYAPHTLDETGACTECMYGYVVQSVYEVIVDAQPFTIVMDKMITWAEFKVNFPQPGRYVLYPNNEEVKICTANDGTGTPTQSAITLDVAEAGEMTLWFRIFDFEFEVGKEVPITYSVIRMDDLVIDTEKGKVELPTNTLYQLKFQAPALGEYKLITSVEGLVIGLTEDTMEYFKGHISFTVTEIGQEFTFFIELNDLERKSFVFDWFLEEPFCLDVESEGNFAIAVSPNQIDYKIEFTAPEAGYYALSVDTQWLTFCYWSEIHNQPVRGDGDLLEKQQILTGWLEAGEVFTTWLQTVYDYPDSVDCRDTLTVTNIGQIVELGDSVLTPGVEGGKFTVTANETAYYCLSVTGGEIGVIGANGSVTWVSYYEAKVYRGYSYSFMVRGEGDVQLNISTKQYAMTLNEGSNVINMAPAKEYDVIFGVYYLLNDAGERYPAIGEDGNPMVDENGNTIYASTPIDFNRIVKLTWDNARLAVYVDNVQVKSGVEVEVLHSTVMIKLLSNVATDVELNVEILNREQQELTGDTVALLQANLESKLLINGSQNPATATFTAEYGGTYVFSFRSDVKVNVYIRSANGEDSFIAEGTDGNYEIQLEVGQSITFVVKVPGDAAVNAYVMIAPK